MLRSNGTISLGLFLLRFGLGLFLASWSLNKIINPNFAVALFSRFYFINIYPSIMMILGALELVLSLLLILGMYKDLTYGLGLALQIIATAGALGELIHNNIIYVSNIPILFAFITLFLLRKIDNRWTLSKKPKMFS